MAQKTARLHLTNSLLDPKAPVTLRHRGRSVGPAFTGPSRLKESLAYAKAAGFTRVVWDDTGRQVVKGGTS